VNQLEERLANLIARQWGAIKSAEPTDIPTIATYLAANILLDGDQDVLVATHRLTETAFTLKTALSDWLDEWLNLTLLVLASSHAEPQPSEREEKLTTACEMALVWLNNLVEAHGQNTIVDSLPNGTGGRVQLAEALG